MLSYSDVDPNAAQRRRGALCLEPPHVFVLPSIKPSQVPPAIYGEGKIRWKTLARVVLANINHHTTGQSTVVLRPDAEPKLAVVGWFTPEEAEHIRGALPWFIDALSRLRYVDYDQVEADCARLGRQLREHLTDEALQEASFVGIPRGGTVVLGLLSYVLDLDHPQINPRDRSSGPLVVVDDCFLSGARLAEFLERHRAPSQIVIAGLYAHPELRANLIRKRRRVQTCVTASDLTDYAPAIYGSEYEAWAARWKDRARGPRYWTGITEHLCFPWSEPDRGIWNPNAERTDEAWRVVPPSRCLKTRFAADRHTDDSIQIQHPVSDTISLTPGVFYALFSDRALVGGSTSGDCVELTGSGVDFWKALVTSETVSDAETALRQKYDGEPERLTSDLRTFVETLVDHDLLETVSLDGLAA